ncbi:18S rRNA pseudouridine methyltransferase [Mitosporidium daphniae]
MSSGLEKKETRKRLIVVLEFCPLEIIRVGKSRDARMQLLNCDDHSNLLRRQQRDPNEFRPDIVHQCLLTLLDSPLNKAGLLQVFVHTRSNVLIEVHPHIRLPRTFPRFAGLFVQLLEKLSIKSSAGERLLSVIKNPITDHLPLGAVRIGLSGDDAKAAVNIRNWISSECSEIAKDKPTVVFIGAMAHGSDDFEFAEKKISISNYPLSASVACGKVCCAWEELWGII